MKLFARLFTALDQTNKTNTKVEILKQYFAAAPDEDKLHMLALFTGRRPRRIVNSTQMRIWAAEAANVPLWLFEESYGVVGDLSETISLLLPPPTQELQKPLHEWIAFMNSLASRAEEERKEALTEAWRGLSREERFVFSKLTSSTFRVGVSQNLVIRALAEHAQIPIPVLTHRLMGNWSPETTSWEDIVAESGEEVQDKSRPYPFFLAHALEKGAENLGTPEEWSAEWKWDGIRAQLIKRGGELYIWSRGEDLVTDRFPEFQILRDSLPDGTVIDGEILPFSEGSVLSFNVLQTRIGRKKLTPKILKDVPVVLFAYDLLEWEEKDIRESPLAERQVLLESLIERHRLMPLIRLSPKVDFDDWEKLADERRRSREMLAEGLMLKRKLSPYQVGRKRGDWWKWKIDPLSVDAVLIYAQRGTGRRANLYTDYTFGVWNEARQLVPFTKAYSGLTDKEIVELDRWIKKNTLNKFGPVRTVTPVHVFEIGFEGIQASGRHKSGVALRFPRILRWRKDKPIMEADTLANLQHLLQLYESGNVK